MNGYNNDGVTALMALMDRCSVKIMNLLLSSGADVNKKDNSSNQALHLAARYTYYVSTIDLLLESGADVNMRNSHGKTPLLEAVSKIHEGPDFIKERPDHVKAVNTLIKAGADVNVETTDGTTALISAADWGLLRCMKSILESGVDVNRGKTENGKTALILASRGCHHECVNTLLTAGADVNATDNDGGNALFLPEDFKHVKFLHRYPQCIKSLFRAGIHINQFGKSRGKNALGILLDYKFKYQNARHSYLLHTVAWYPTEVNYEAAIMLLYAAGETLEGTEEDNIPEVLKFEDEKLELKHMCRETIRKHLQKLDPHHHLFGRVPRLGLPNALTRYLLFEQSLDGDDDDDDDDDDDVWQQFEQFGIVPEYVN